MSESITATFDYAGGEIEAEISAKYIEIVFHYGNTTMVIEDSQGDCYRFDHYNFTLLHGAALEAFQTKKAREYAIDAFGAHMAFVSEELAAA